MKTQTAVQAKPLKNFREFERENADVKKGEHIKAPLTRFSVKPGFNPRDLEKPETQAKIAELQAAYEAGEFVPLAIVRMALDGKSAEIVDGECRYTAALRAHEAMLLRGEKGIEEWEAIRFNGSEAQAKALTMRANSGEGLTPMEQADLVEWYLAEGFKRDDISKHLGKGLSWIDRLISFTKLTPDLKQQVRDNKLSADEAVKYMKRHGEDAAKVVEAKLDEAKVKGETKVTPKHDDQKTAPKEDPKQQTLPEVVKADEVNGTQAPVQQLDPQPAPERGQTLPPQEKPAKQSKADEKAQQHALRQYDTARQLAIALPDKIKAPRNMQIDGTYEVVLTGAAIRLLMEMQKVFTAEIEDHVKANKAAA